jgi:hypothetical protein
VLVKRLLVNDASNTSCRKHFSDLTNVFAQACFARDGIMSQPNISDVFGGKQKATNVDEKEHETKNAKKTYRRPKSKSYDNV